VSNVLGSEAETRAFGAEAITYQPEGVAHAVDPAGAVLAYAVCGKPVRVWPDQPFDATAEQICDACAALTQPD
jgi:hypothetical protein